MAERKERIKVGIIGCGYATEELHLPALRSLAQAQILALTDIDCRRLDTVADRFNIEHRYTDFRAMLDNPDIELIGICSPPQFHVEMAMAGLEAGKHVLIEKPLALDLDETDRLVACAARSHRKAMVGFNLRFHSQARMAREIIQQGALGPIEFIRTVSSSGYRFEPNYPEYRKHRELGGGVLIELAVHHFDLWRFLLGSEINEVTAVSRSEDCDDLTASVTAQMTDGIIASSVFSQCAAENNEVEVFGLRGRLLLSFYRFDGLEVSSGSSYSGDLRSRLRGILNTIEALPQGILGIARGGVFFSSYRMEWQNLINCILRDNTVGCTLEDGKRALQVALAVVQSAHTRRSVRIADTARSVGAIYSIDNESVG